MDPFLFPVVHLFPEVLFLWLEVHVLGRVDLYLLLFVEWMTQVYLNLHEWRPKDCYEMKMHVAVEIVFDFFLMKLVLVLLILVRVAAVLVDH